MAMPTSRRKPHHHYGARGAVAGPRTVPSDEGDSANSLCHVFCRLVVTVYQCNVKQLRAQPCTKSPARRHGPIQTGWRRLYFFHVGRPRDGPARNHLGQRIFCATREAGNPHSKYSDYLAWSGWRR